MGDDRPAADQARAIARRPRPRQRPGHRRRVVPVDPLHLPAIGGEARRHVLAEAEVRRPIDRDVIVIVEVDELAEPEVPGQARRLRRHALHQVTVADDRVGAMIDDLQPRPVVGRRQEALRQRHPDARREPGPERTRGHLHPDRVPVLRVPRRLRAPLAKALQLRQRQVVAAQVQQRVQQHRAVPGAQYKPVTVWPQRRLRVVYEELPPQHAAHHCGAHRHPRVPRVGRLNGVNRQRLDRIDDLRQRSGWKDARGQGYAGRHRGLTYHANRGPGYAQRRPIPAAAV